MGGKPRLNIVFPRARGKLQVSPCEKEINAKLKEIERKSLRRLLKDHELPHDCQAIEEWRKGLLRAAIAASPRQVGAGEDSVDLSFLGYEVPGLSASLPDWWRLYDIPQAKAKALYEPLEKFLILLNALDPKGKRREWADAIASDEQTALLERVLWRIGLAKDTTRSVRRRTEPGDIRAAISLYETLKVLAPTCRKWEQFGVHQKASRTPTRSKRDGVKKCTKKKYSRSLDFLLDALTHMGLLDVSPKAVVAAVKEQKALSKNNG